MAQTTTQIGRMKVAHPDLGYDTADGGVNLHADLNTMFKAFSDHSTSRYFEKTFTSAQTHTLTHNFNMSLDSLTVYLYDGSNIFQAGSSPYWTLTEIDSNSFSIKNNTASSASIQILVFSFKGAELSYYQAAPSVPEATFVDWKEVKIDETDDVMFGVYSPELTTFCLTGGSYSRISTDGINWIRSSSKLPASPNYCGCWANTLGKFVIAGGTSNALLSSDGLSWTLSNPIGVTNPYGMCWSEEQGKIVAVGFIGSLAVSSDGMTWNSYTNGTNNWVSVCYSPELNLFVAVAYTGTNRVMVSSDGVSWTSYASSDETTTWWSVCWSPTLGKFVAVGYSGTARIMYSSNGTSWTTASTVSVPFYSVVWSESRGVFCALSSDGKLYTSTDGISWKRRDNNGTLTALSYSSLLWSEELDMFLSLQYSTTPAYRVYISKPIQDKQIIEILVPNKYSKDMARKAVSSHEYIPSPVCQKISQQYNALAYSPELGLLVASDLNSQTLYVSDDGKNWGVGFSSSPNSVNCIAWSPELKKFVALGSSVQLYSEDGFNWRRVATINTGENWTSVCWSPELGLFCAVANSGTGRIMTSPDGYVWTTVTDADAEGNSWNSICWSPELGLFCAVGGGTTNRVITSPDGTNWTPRTPASTNTWKSVCWSPSLDLFAAVSTDGAGNRIMTSSDGIVWSSQTNPENNTWESVAWSEEAGNFLAVSSDGTNRLMKSSNGTTWTSVVGVTAGVWKNLCWASTLAGKGYFVGVSAGTGEILLSTTGSTGTTYDSSYIESPWMGISWISDLGCFIASANTSDLSGYEFALSSDGKKWVTSGVYPGIGVGGGTSVAWNPKLGKLVSLSGSFYNVGKDGFFWEYGTPASNLAARAICFSPELDIFVAVGGGTTSNSAWAKDPNPLVTSWSNGNSLPLNLWTSVCWSPELRMFVTVACTGPGNRAAYSYDGQNWTSSTIENNAWESVCWSNKLKMFCAVSSTGNNRVAISKDGINWTYISVTSSMWMSVCWSEELGMFYAVALAGNYRVMTSFDGMNWEYFPGVKNLWNHCCWSPELGVFCSVSSAGNRNRIMLSNDVGVYSPKKISPKYSGTALQVSEANRVTKKWYSRVNSVANAFTSICWSPELSLFVAVANTGTATRVMTSPDGKTWTTRTSAADSMWNSVCWSAELELFVAVAFNNIMTSVDGVSGWTTRTSPAANTWQSVCWSAELGKFVAVSSDGTSRVMTSTNGTAWATSSIEASSWNSVCWSPELGKFVAVAYSGTNRAATSSDGTTWTSVSVPSNQWSSVCWSPELGIFCAVGLDGAIMVSSDGNTWTAGTTLSYSLKSICWSPELGIFCAVDIIGTGDRVLISRNGLTWFNRTSAANNQWYSVCWSAALGIFCAVSIDGTNRVMTSKNMNLTSELVNLRLSRGFGG